jgi:hypothetical protein
MPNGERAANVPHLGALYLDGAPCCSPSCSGNSPAIFMAGASPASAGCLAQYALNGGELRERP